MCFNMSIIQENIKGEKQDYKTTDADLVELAGYHAYKSYDIGDIEYGVNGKQFRVVHTVRNPQSGFEALTARNMETDEISITYVGSQDIINDWILTNPMLLSDTPPQQIQDAIDYYDWVNDNVGEVSSITGYTLAGALTNGVAFENRSDLKFVLQHLRRCPFNALSLNQYKNFPS